MSGALPETLEWPLPGPGLFSATVADARLFFMVSGNGPRYSVDTISSSQGLQATLNLTDVTLTARLSGSPPPDPHFVVRRMAS